MTYAGHTLMTHDAGAWPFMQPGAVRPPFPFARPAAPIADKPHVFRKRQGAFPFMFGRGFRRDAGAVMTLDTGFLADDAGAVMEIDAGAVVAMDAGFLDTGFLDAGYVVNDDAGFIVTDSGLIVSDAGAVMDVGFMFDDARGVASELDLLDPDAGFMYDDAGNLFLMNGGPLADLEAAGFFDDVKNFFKKKVAPLVKRFEKFAAPALDMIQTAASAIPGYGTIISGALGAARGAAQGKSLAQIGMQAFGSMIPGGAIGQGIAKTALGAIEGALAGKSAGKIAKSALASVPIGNKGGLAGNITALAQNILASPALRNLPTGKLASALKTSPSIAHAAQQIIMGRMGAHAPAGKSIEQALALAGRPAPAAARPQISRAIPRPRLNFAGLMPRRDAAGIDPNQPSIYIVEPGDTYVRIAAKLGRPGQHLDLYKANPQIGKDTLGNPAIHPGTRLNIPAGWMQTSVQPSPYTLPPAPGQLPQTPVPYPQGGTIVLARGHVVQPGDTLQKIAAQFGHPGEEMAIYAINKPPAGPMAFGADVLHAGWVLNLPTGWGGQGETPPPAPMPAPVPSQPMPQTEPPLTGIPPWLDPNSPEFGKYPTPSPGQTPVPVPVPAPSPGQTPAPFPSYPAPGPGSMPPQPQQPPKSEGSGLGTIALPLALMFLLGK